MAKLGGYGWLLVTAPLNPFCFGLAIVNYKSILSKFCSFLNIRKEPKETCTGNK
ncbi:MAG: hypothetical protein KF721_03850 [Ignavibacteriaceae bacterium]|nr:hypothetical protein [Ignavibacteriaceae bacterium]